MTPEEILTACHDLGLTVRADGDRLFVSPREKLTDDLRQRLRDNKEAVIVLLSPASFENPRSLVKRLEKELGTDQPTLPAIAYIDEGECAHSNSDVTAALALLRRDRMDRGYDLKAQAFVFFLSAEKSDACDVCRMLKRSRA